MAAQGKEYWKSLARAAQNKLAEVCPGSLPKDRAEFVSDLEANKTKMNHLKRQQDKKGRSMGDTLRDWFRTWLHDKAANEASARQIDKKATAGNNSGKQGYTVDDEGWTTRSARKSSRSGSAATPSPTSSSNASASTSTSPTSSRTSRNSPFFTRSGTRRTSEDAGGVWKELEVAEETPLVDAASGVEATKLDISSPVDTAAGYFFCNTDLAAELYDRYARAPNPITFILPPYDGNTREDIKKALDKHQDRLDGIVNPGIMESTMLVKDPTTGRKRNVATLLVHVDRGQPILPPQQIEDGMLFSDALPSVTLDLPTDVDLLITVVAPICRELGLTEWWEKLKGRP